MPLVALDAGHGSNTWEDTGGKGVVMNGRVFEEHWFNAAVVKKLKPLLEYNGIDTFYTQPPNERDIGLDARTDEANRKGADVFWSVHANASASEDAQGRCAFYWYTSDSGKHLAELYAKHMEAAGYDLHGDGLHACVPGTWTNLHVCRETTMTAVLTENGFFTNPEELAMIRSDEYRQAVAEIHAKTLCDYLGISFDKPNKEDDDMADEEKVHDWAKDAQDWIQKHGISSGIRPQANVTREEAWTMLYRYHKEFHS